MRDRLRALPIFEDVDDAQLERLAAATSEFEAPAGQALIERGRPGSGMFVLEEGQAVVEAPEGTRQLGPGDTQDGPHAAQRPGGGRQNGVARVHKQW